jgi:hypothetical protein
MNKFQITLMDGSIVQHNSSKAIKVAVVGTPRSNKGEQVVAWSTSPVYAGRLMKRAFRTGAFVFVEVVDVEKIK